MTVKDPPQSPRRTRKPPRPVRVWYVVLMGLVAILGGFVLTIGFISQVSKSRQADTCEVVMTQLAVYNETPPSTPTGIKARDAWAHLRQTLNCDEVERK